MDLNELFSRHQQALIAMVHNASPSCRDFAEKRANEFADQIKAVQQSLNAIHLAGDHQILKSIIRG